MSMIGYFLLASDDAIDRAIADPESAHQLTDVEDSDDLVDVDKAWHCLHFLFTGTAWEGEWPLNFIVGGGTEIGDDIGYGPARAFRSTQVTEIAGALRDLTVTALQARFDGKRMDDLQIYPSSPGAWAGLEPLAGSELGYFMGAFENVKALVTKGAERHLGLLVWLS